MTDKAIEGTGILKRLGAVGYQVERGVRPNAELLERLRDWADETYVLQEGELPAVRSDLAAAADEIDRLRTELLCASEDVKKWRGLAEVARVLANLEDRRTVRASRLGLGA